MLANPTEAALSTELAEAVGRARDFAQASKAIDKIALEEVRESNGWHLLGYNWTTKRYVDLMNGFGVTGTKSACCGYDVFEVHGAPGSSCGFDPSFPIGTHLLYDEKKQVLLNGVSVIHHQKYSGN